MKTLDDIKHLVSRIGYKPGWRIEVFATQGGALYLQVRFTSTDPHTQVVGEQGGRKWFLSAHMTDGEVVQTALMAILAAEEHEAREFFTFEGRAIFGPHFNLQKLVPLCDENGATEVRTTGASSPTTT
jgi:hypothetical protein